MVGVPLALCNKYTTKYLCFHFSGISFNLDDPNSYHKVARVYTTEELPIKWINDGMYIFHSCKCAEMLLKLIKHKFILKSNYSHSGNLSLYILPSKRQSAAFSNVKITIWFETTLSNEKREPVHLKP